jgi:MFS transporter, PAT family, beta-lactamase induction signal transducer AmpG
MTTAKKKHGQGAKWVILMFSSKSYFFVILYFVQGVALAYFTGFQKRYLASEGIHSDYIATLSSLVILPFILKPFFGLVADSFSLPRKPVIAVGLGLAVISFLGALKVSPSDSFILFSMLMLMASVGVSVFDTIADALAVDAFQSSEFASLQSYMLAGKSLGLIVFSVLFGVMIDASGYENVFWFLAIAMIVPFLAWGSVKSAPRKEPFQWSAFKTLTQDYVVAIATFGVLYSIPSFGLSGLFAYYFSELGLSATAVGKLESVKSVGAVLGALSFAALIKKFSIKKIAVVATFAAVFVGVVVPLSNSLLYFYLMMAAFGLIWALRETIFTTLAMQVTKPAIAATMFSLLMAFSNLGTSIGEGWATAAAGRQGFEFTFVLFGLLNVVSLWYFVSFKRPKIHK